MIEILKANEEFIKSTLEKTMNKISKTSDRVKDGMPYTTRDGLYDNWEDNAQWWTNTFWTGILWLMYKETQEEKYKLFADSIEDKMDAVLYGYDQLHHDVGFMWLLSSVMNFELTGNEKSRKRAMIAANVLFSRCNVEGGYIRAWNGDNEGLAIIDCMMNIPLLYWASKQTNDKRFNHIANIHAKKSMTSFVRPDGSCNHMVVFDADTGEVVDNPKGGGYESGSSWARGQSWAVYGYAQAYHWTQNLELSRSRQSLCPQPAHHSDSPGGGWHLDAQC